MIEREETKTAKRRKQLIPFQTTIMPTLSILRILWFPVALTRYTQLAMLRFEGLKIIALTIWLISVSVSLRNAKIHIDE